jgi:hypothetical protein
LENNCEKDLPLKLRASSLKAIGNIGYTSDKAALELCALNKNISLELRVNAIRAFRKFSCESMEDLNGMYEMLRDSNEDTEIRINSFRAIMRCSDSSEKYLQFAKEDLTKFLLKEDNKQVIFHL